MSEVKEIITLPGTHPLAHSMHSSAINLFLLLRFGLEKSFNSFSISSSAQNSWNVSVIHLEEEKKKKRRKRLRNQFCWVCLEITSYFFSSRIAFASKESERKKNFKQKCFFKVNLYFTFAAATAVAWCLSVEREHNIIANFNFIVISAPRKSQRKQPPDEDT